MVPKRGVDGLNSDCEPKRVQDETGQALTELMRRGDDIAHLYYGQERGSTEEDVRCNAALTLPHCPGQNDGSNGERDREECDWEADE
jgi:hypothetical protein